MKKDIMDLAEAAKGKNTHVRNSLEKILREIEKIDAGQSIYIDLRVPAHDSHGDGTIHFCTGSFDFFSDCSLYDGMEALSEGSYPWNGLNIADVKACLAAMPEALERLVVKLEKIAGYEIPEKLKPFLAE